MLNASAIKNQALLSKIMPNYLKFFFQTAGAFVTFGAVLDSKRDLVPKCGYMKYLPPSEHVDAEGLYCRLDP